MACVVSTVENLSVVACGAVHRRWWCNATLCSTARLMLTAVLDSTQLIAAESGLVEKVKKVYPLYPP
jgi:hypothetical protein